MSDKSLAQLVVTETWLSVAESARVTGLPVSAIRHLVEQGAPLKLLRPPGGRVRIARSSLDRAVNEIVG